MKVTYRGPAHVREVSPSDFRKFGVEREATTFRRGESIIVNKDVAAILYNFGSFDQEGVEEEVPADPEASGGEQPNNSVPSGTDDPPADDPKTPTSKKAKGES